MCGTEMRKILKHCSTCWLSLGVCISRLLRQWEPLTNFFREECKPADLKAAKQRAKQVSTVHTSSSKDSSSASGRATKGSSKSSSDATGRSSSSAKGSSSSSAKIRSSSSTKGSSSSSAESSSSSSSKGSSSSSAESSSSSSAKGSSSSSAKGSSSSSAKGSSSSSANGSSSSSAKDCSSSSAKGSSSSSAKGSFLSSAKSSSSSSAKHSSSSSAKDSSSSSSSRVQRIRRLLVSSETKLYCLFLQNAIGVFDGPNIRLQSESPLIHKLQRELHGLFRAILVWFVKPAVIISEDLLHVLYKERVNQKDDEDLVIGQATRNFITESLTEKKLSQGDVTTFYQMVRDFFVTAADYLLAKLPLNDELLFHAEVADVSLRVEKSFESVMHFTTKFPILLGKEGNHSEQLDKLELEFAAYQAEPLPEDISTGSKIDVQWQGISQLKDCEGINRFGVLSRVVKGILVISHSNASCERLFSMVGKNMTENRPNLSNTALESLLIQKVDNRLQMIPCYRKTYKGAAGQGQEGHHTSCSAKILSVNVHNDILTFTLAFTMTSTLDFTLVSWLSHCHDWLHWLLVPSACLKLPTLWGSV